MLLSVHVMLHDQWGRTSEIARMTINSDKPTHRVYSNYIIRTLKKNGVDGKFHDALDDGVIHHFASTSLPIWYLVLCAIYGCGYRLPDDVDFVPVPPASPQIKGTTQKHKRARARTKTDSADKNATKKAKQTGLKKRSV